MVLLSGYFWSVTNSLEGLVKWNASNKPVENVYSSDFFTLYTTLPHDLIKQTFFISANGVLTKQVKNIIAVIKDRTRQKLYLLACEDVIYTVSFLTTFRR